MNWENYKELFKKRKIDESQFVLGIDLGNSTSSIAFFDANRGVPEIIDISGGYGKPSMPTAMQYIADSKEWTSGEYAVLNRESGREITVLSLLERLSRNEFVEIDGKPVSIISILGMYIKELIGSCKNLNPKAEIAGIVFAIPGYLSEETKTAFLAAFSAAGYGNAVIGFASDRECIFNYYYFNRSVVEEKVLLLDFAGRELRGGIYEIEPAESGAKIVSVSSLFDKSLGTQKINGEVSELFKKYYCNELNVDADKIGVQTAEQISAFTYQHKDILFQRNEKGKPIKLYFNFAYPPFQKIVTKQDADSFISPFKTKMLGFLKELFTKTLLPEDRVSAENIDTILCTGGGFEMFWARQTVAEMFPAAKIVFYKNSKAVPAEGACIRAAEKLALIGEKKFVMTDLHRLKADIGVRVMKDARESFVCLMDKNSFWWQQREPAVFIISEQIEETPVTIEIVKRDEAGGLQQIGFAELDGLPQRPAYTTRLSMEFAFKSYNLLELTVSDLGFGELFQKSDYRKHFSFEL